MTIGAVSSVSLYQYATSVEYQYFGTTFSDQTLQSLMDQYGIVQTGDSVIDIYALYQAMSSAVTATNDAKAASNPQRSDDKSQPAIVQDPSNAPWANLMNQIGLSPTGNLSTDLTAFINKIQFMQTMATSQQDKASLYQLEAEANIVFAQPYQQIQSVSSPQQSSSHSQPNISGADIMAQLNKIILFS